MCKVLNVRHVEDCFDGDFMKEYEIDTPLDTSIMERLAHKAVLKYYADFPRPYFRIDKQDAYTIKGVIGKTTFQVILSRSAPSDIEVVLKTYIEKGDFHGCETSTVF